MRDAMRVRYCFVGLVQNRGFRYACWKSAEKAGCTGWVRNERDRSVTAEIQGTAEQLAAFMRELARVVYGFGDNWSVGEQREISPRQDEDSFNIKF